MSKGRTLGRLLLLSTSMLLITGCGLEEYKYTGNELVFKLDAEDTQAFNEDGGKAIVDRNQAFFTVGEDGEVKYFNTGEHTLEKSKNQTYSYYFLSLEEQKDKQYGSKESFDFKDQKYGFVKMNSYGDFSYKITNPKKVFKYFIKEDITLDEYVGTLIIDALKEELNALNVTYTELPNHYEKVVPGVITRLSGIGIELTELTVKSADISAESLSAIKKIEENEMSLNLLINNTVWVATDKSELQFKDGKFNWYQTQAQYNDNVQYGSFHFFIGESAVQYITEDLASFGVTRSELQVVFDGSDQFNLENFVAFQIDLEGYKINGKTTNANQPIYWYGFIMKNNTFIQVVNMKTGAYYNFNKKVS